MYFSHLDGEDDATKLNHVTTIIGFISYYNYYFCNQYWLKSMDYSFHADMMKSWNLGHMINIYVFISIFVNPITTKIYRK